MAPDGVFAQWVQTYRVPIGVVAVVVANMRQVFPHVELWFSNAADLILIASNQPIVWDQARLAGHFGVGTPTRQAFKDWLEVDQPSQLLGRYLLGDKGTAALAATASFTHDDERPALEFVAARGLLAVGLPSVFDSLLGVRMATGDTLPRLAGWNLAPGEWELAYVSSLHSDHALTMRYAERMLAAAPGNAERQGAYGVLLFKRNQFNASLVRLREALRTRPNDPQLLLHAGLASNATGDMASGRALLERARAAGGDSVYASSALAEAAVGVEDWERAATEAIRALQGVRPTIAAPFPGALQSAVRLLAERAPPEIAAPVMEEAVRSRPSWDLAYWGGAMTYLRWGGEHCRRAAQLADELTRFGWTDSEVVLLLRRCRTSQ